MNGVVFVSYATEDTAAVLELVGGLEKAGIRVWLDRKDLLGGQEWGQEIELAIESSSLFIFCLSHSSCSKTGFVQHEIRYAYEQAKLRPESQVYIIPVRLEECSPPRALRHLQYIDMFDPSGLSRLIFSVKQHLNWLPHGRRQEPAVGILSESVEHRLSEEEQYALACDLGHKEWQDRLSTQIFSPAAILMCLEAFELRALRQLRAYRKDGKYGTFSAVLSDDGEKWLHKALNLNLVSQLARRDNERSGWTRTVTLSLGEVGRKVIHLAEAEPLASLAVPPSLSELTPFDLELAADLTWKCQVSDGLLRLKKNRYWDRLLHPLIDARLYSVEHDNGSYLTLSWSQPSYRIDQALATVGHARSACGMKPLQGLALSYLEELRSRASRARLPYIRIQRAEAAVRSQLISVLEEKELVATRTVGSTLFLMVATLGVWVNSSGELEVDLDEPEPTLFESMRPIDE